MPVERWFPRTLQQEDTLDGFTITLTTNTPCHLWLYWTDHKTWAHQKSMTDRGLVVMDAGYWCFVAWHKIEQDEPGDTTTHTFTWPSWVKCQTRYFRFHGEIAGEDSPSDSPILHKHKTEEVPEMYVISLGKFTEEQLLHGHVKLEEGANVTLTRNDENNSLIIAAAGAEPAPYIGFGNSLIIRPSVHPESDNISLNYDSLTIGTGKKRDEFTVHTGTNLAWDYRAPHTMSFAAKRDPQATMRPTTYSAMVDDVTDLHNNLTHRHIAFIERSNKIYASCGNGAGRTEVELSAVGYSSRHWLKWARTAEGVEFYINGVLMTTITDTVPGILPGCRFLWQSIASGYDAVRYVSFTHPHHSEA